MSLDLSLTETEEILKTSVMSFLKRDVPKETLQALHDSDTGFTAEILRKIIEMGLMGVVIPEEYGGAGYPLTTAGVLFEALGTGPLPGPYFSSGILGSLIIQEAGTGQQKEEILPQVAEGKMILAPAITEPKYGWEADNIETVATSKDGGYELNGVKLFVHDALSATHLIVPAIATGKSGKAISLFLVDKNSAGVKVRLLPGYLSGRAFEVKMDGVKVPPSSLLAGQGEDGWTPLVKAIDKSIPILCAYKVGGCQAVFDMTAEYSRVRIQFGQAIGRFQRVQDLVIDIATQMEAARWTTYEALWKLDTNLPAFESIHLAKAVASEGYWQSCILAHRVFSGIGYSTEHSLSLHTRASRYFYSYLGEPSYHKQQLAKHFLK